MRPVREVRIGETGGNTEQHAAHSPEHGGDDERVEAVAAHAHAEILRLVRILADRSQAETEGRAHDAQHDGGGRRQQDERVVVERPREELNLVEVLQRLAEQEGAQHAHAFVATGEVIELAEKGVEQHAEGEREHAEVDLHVAHGEQADRYGHRHRHRGRRQQDELHVEDVQLAREPGRRVGPERHEERVAEGQQPRVAEEQVEAEQRDAVAEGGQHQRRRVRPARERQQQKRDARHRERHAADHAVALANRPAGRTTRTPITIT